MEERETAVFRAAVERLKLKTIDAPRLFGVSRQTFGNWTNGNTKVPPKAFVLLVEYENQQAALDAAAAARSADLESRVAAFCAKTGE